MKVLAFDCAGNACAAALVRAGAVLAQRLTRLERGHAQLLAPMIEAVMKEAGTRFSDLDLIAVTTGPGSFTGVRIGLATARGLALAADCPLVGVTSFAAIAAGIAPLADLNLVVAVDSKRAEFYVQAFGPDGAALTPP
ncbi:MAG TPA: tRNA (adenosine(37)-N6)-threonylcarbamoyltransferase complex dimerization subunit type 1 TsaB, partial [Stellaceae bacterium]|nr:tRNA (adenosine(37)-N6)-threonylcarbamoyltransferase complex dimerization subunit type 1 TsaB [Stellaceae bacterium]